jgi:hypothetical protein
VHSAPDFQADVFDRQAEFWRTRQRRQWVLEEREEAVAGELDVLAPVPGEAAAHQTIVILEQVTPACVAQVARLFCRSDDVGEKDGCQPPTAGESATAAREERLRLVGNRIAIREPVKMIGAGQLDESSTLDPRSEEASLSHWHHRVSRACRRSRAD